MKHISIILLFLCGWFAIGPSVYAAKTVKGWKKADNALWIQTRTQTLRLQPYTGGILSVQWGNKEDIQNNHSYAVTETPAIADFHVQENKSDIRLQCAPSLSINRAVLYNYSLSPEPPRDTSRGSSAVFLSRGTNRTVR